MKLNKNLRRSALLFITFVLYIILVKTVDVKAIGPDGTKVGFAYLNSVFANTFVFSKFWYGITDFLGNLAILICAGFGFLGLFQLIKRKRLEKVDRDIIILGLFYIVVILTYVFFEFCIVNYRPVIMPGAFEPEASFPSSHTMLAICVFVTSIMQFSNRIKAPRLSKIVQITLLVFLGVMIFGRVFSGIHWITDIIGSLIISSCYINLYKGVILLGHGRKNKHF